MLAFLPCEGFSWTRQDNKRLLDRQNEIAKSRKFEFSYALVIVNKIAYTSESCHKLVIFFAKTNFFASVISTDAS